MRRDKKKEEQKRLLANIFKGALGMGAVALAAKKAYDYYNQAREEELMSSWEYERDIRNRKSGLADGLDGGDHFFKEDLIELDASADKLFRLFLSKIEEVAELPTQKFKLSDIEKIMPYEDTELTSKSNYNYGIMSMLGSQAGRDYFIFDNQGLKENFTSECNKPNRDNNYWRRYREEGFQINPKYINDLYLD